MLHIAMEGREMFVGHEDGAAWSVCHALLWGEPDQLQIGYMIDGGRDTEGKGIMTAFMLAILPMIPPEYRNLWIYDGHRASERVAEKCGFVRSGKSCGLEGKVKHWHLPTGAA